MSNDYTGPMRSSAPSGSPSQYTDPKQIDAILKSSDPGAVAEAGRSYQKFAGAYEKIAGQLLSMRDDLHDAWSGADAAAAQAQLREVWSAATTVHKTADTFGSTIERHGSEYLGWYKNNKPPSTSLAEAQSWMTGANERVSQSWSSLPPDLSTTLPPGLGSFAYGPASSGSSVGTAGSDGVGSGGAGLGGEHAPGAARRLTSDQEGTGGTGSDLAGYSPPGGAPAPGLGMSSGGIGGGTPPLPAGGYAVGSGPSGGGIVGFGPGSLRVPRATPGGRLPGSGGVSPSEAEASAAESATGTRADGALGPMAGGREAEERERKRRSWLAEDEDVWTADIESTPEVIGAIEPATPKENGEKTSAEAPIEIDLAAGGDELAAILAEIGGDPDPETKPEAASPDVSTQIAELREQLARLERQRDAESGLPSAIEDAASDRDWLRGEGF